MATTKAVNELAIIEIPEENALALFTTKKGLDPLLDEVFKHARSFVPDLSTQKGRDAIASVAYKVSKSKTAIDAVRKNLVSKLKEQPKLVDAEGKRVRDLLDGLRDEVRQPLTDWENAEKLRVDCHKSMIQHIKDCGIGLIGGEPQPHVILLRELEEKIVIDEKFEEFQAEAVIARDESLVKIRASLEEHSKRQAEQAELERLRIESIERVKREREERIAREATEAAQRKAQQEAEDKRIEAEKQAQAERDEAQREKLEAERKANDERQAAERRELELRLASERAEREKLEAQHLAEQAEANAKAELERQAEAERQQAAKRESDTNHRKSINNAAVDGLLKLGLDQAQCKAVVTAIAKGEIKNVRISY